MARRTIIGLAAVVLEMVVISPNADAWGPRGGSWNGFNAPHFATGFPGGFGGPHFFGGPRFFGGFPGGFPARDIRADRRDVFRDRIDVRQDFRMLNRDLRFGTPAQVAADRADIAGDVRDIRQDRVDLRRDFHPWWEQRRPW
jgi:hypothetical protein